MTQQEYHLQDKQLIAVDCIIFGYEKGELKLLLFKRQLEPKLGSWSLIGGWVDINETVEKAAGRVLFKITGLNNIFQEQVKVFSDPNRDPGGRVVSLAFYSLIDIRKHNKELVNQYGAKWWPVSKLPELIFDHSEMVNESLKKLRTKATHDIVGRDLLPVEFTITQLRQLYNSIFVREFDMGNFRKKILSLNALERLDKKDNSDSKKGAYYYTVKKLNETDEFDRIIKI